MKKGAAHLHHLTYIRRGNELPADVMYLCLRCHGVCHPHHTFRPIWVQREIAAGRGKVKERQQRQRKNPPPLPEKDPAYARVQELLAQRKEQRQRSAKKQKLLRYG